MIPITGLLPFFFGIVIIGLTCLMLVASELGKRARLTLPGRFALMGALGFGVFAFSLKTGIIIYLDSLGREDLVAARAPAPRPQIVIQTAPAAPPDPDAWPVWRALPARAPTPPGNPQSKAKTALGKALFFDANLSADRSLSCASCHRLGEGGDDNAAVSTGIDGQKGNRNAPSVINAAFLSRLFWDGRAASLEAQARGPLLNPVEMGMPSHRAVAERVKENAEYKQAFASIFGGSAPVNISNIAKAIAAYERTLITPRAAYDRYVAGDESALSPQQLRGMALFQEKGCRNCHLDPTFSSAGRVKPFGIYRTFPVFPDNAFVRKYGLMEDGKPRMWRVPSLRNVARTAPYFHNGSVKRLEEAIRVMAVSQLQKVLSDDPADDMQVTSIREAGGKPALRLTVTRGRAMSGQDIADIAAFLRSLSAAPPQS